MLDTIALGKRIQERRKVQGMTQEQLGNELGVSAQAVSKWEKGESTPDMGLLPELCRMLGISSDTLLGIGGGLGIEALGTELAKRIAQQRGEAKETAMMQAILRLQTIGYPPDGHSGPKKQIFRYDCGKGDLVELHLWSNAGFVCTVLRSALQAGPVKPERLALLRLLVSPLHWEITQALLEGPSKVPALLEAGVGESKEELRDALDTLLEAGLVRQEREGYVLETWEHGLLWAAVLRALGHVEVGGSRMVLQDRDKNREEGES